MTAKQMRWAVAEIRKGKTFRESTLSDTPTNRRQWNELLEEIHYGYSIDMPVLDNIISLNKSITYDRA